MIYSVSSSIQTHEKSVSSAIYVYIDTSETPPHERSKPFERFFEMLVFPLPVFFFITILSIYTILGVIETQLQTFSDFNQEVASVCVMCWHSNNDRGLRQFFPVFGA